MNEAFLKDLLSAISVSGFEEPVQDVVEQELGACADEIRRDEMQNLVAVKNPGSQRRILLSAHADEIGLMVSNITAEGRLQAVRRGGIVPHTYPGHQVIVRTEQGEIYGAVEASRKLLKEPELMEKEFLIDIGADTKEEAERLVSIGDPVVQDTHIRRLAGGRFCARALDDRIGVYIIMEAFRRAAEQGCDLGIYAAATAGEETTKTGAYRAASRVKPELAIIVDVTYTSDCTGMDPAESGPVRLGGGPVLCHSPLVPRGLNRQLEAVGKELGIPVQWEVASDLSHTDGDKIHFANEGIPILLVSIPLRYMHMPAEVADERDVEGCIDLIAGFLMQYR